MDTATKLARTAIEAARDLLATRLAEAGGLAAEVASCRERWPEPRIHWIPEARDRAADIERLRRRYEELRDQHDDEDGGSISP